MTYDWLYLCGDPAKLHITLDYLFLQGKELTGLNKMVVGYCSHLDPVGRREELQSVIWHRRPGWIPCELRDLSYLGEASLPRELKHYWSTGKTRWSLAVKLVIPAMFTGPFLYTDDDVVMFSDPIDMLSFHGWGSKGSFRLPSQKRYVAEQIWDAIGIPRTADTDATHAYNDHALDAGVFWSGESWADHTRDSWLEYLKKFATCDYIQRLTVRDLELRCLDQRFLTSFGLLYGWDRMTISNGFAPPERISESLTRRHPFLHYKTSSKLSKARWMDALRTYYYSAKSRA